MRLFVGALGNKLNGGTGRSGIAFTHDDTGRTPSIADYYRSYGNANGWKATIMMNNFNSSHYADVTTLVNGGCELGNHTTTHYEFVDAYVAANGAQAYYNNYVQGVEPQIENFSQTQPFSFAWPFGNFNQLAFDYIRDTGKYGIIRNYSAREYPPSIPASTALYGGGHEAGAMTLEEYYGAFAIDLDMHKEFMRYALNNDLVYITISHDIKDRGTFNPTTELATATEDLNALVDYANQIGLSIITLKEAYNLYL